MPARFARKRDGTFAVRLVAEEREILRSLPAQLRGVLASGDTDDPGLRRLYPPAFLEDEEASTAFGELTHGDLERQRNDSADLMASSIDSSTLTEEELSAWLAVINDTRLVLGSRLGLTEETKREDLEGDARAAFMLYRYLTDLTMQIVKALSGVSESGLFKDVMRRQWKEQREQGGG